VSAAPSIDAIEGSLLPGSSVKITGSGFSSELRKIDLKDESDSYSLLTLGKTLSVAGTDNLWVTEGSPWAKPLLPVPVDDESRGGFVYQGQGKAYNQYIGPLKDADTKTLYVSWLYKPSESPGHSQGSNKFIRVWDDHSGEGTRISWTGMHMIYSDVTGETRPTWGGWSGKVGEWNRMEIWVDGVGGEIIASINGVAVHNVDDFVKVPNGIGLNIKLLGFDPSVATPYANMITQIDDLYVSTTRARVLLSDEPAWADAKITGDTLIPSSWTDSEVTLKLSTGERALIEKKYLYVVDKDGVANSEGYELCGSCPKPPQLTAN
tara:strand:- start:431 stop:1393 length:963 start_codon:yes stop_codon:yes gene_type:complete